MRCHSGNMTGFYIHFHSLRNDVTGKFPSTDSPSRCPRQPGLGQVEARKQKLYPSLPCGWQGPGTQCLPRHMPPARAATGSRVNTRAWLPIPTPLETTCASGRVLCAASQGGHCVTTAARHPQGAEEPVGLCKCCQDLLGLTQGDDKYHAASDSSSSTAPRTGSCNAWSP